MATTILVTGANGQLGSELKELAPLHPQFDFVFFTREGLSIADEDALKEAFRKNRPAYFINCAAYTAVDRAEEERAQAFAINGEAVGTIARLCRENGCRLVHISTDYVFDGEQREPLREDAPVKPVNAYGESKLLGEELALRENPEAVIIRTAWVYSAYGKNFVKTMIRLMNEREQVSVVADQTGSPTYAADLAEAILQIVAHPQWTPGIYHYSNEGIITWYDFAKAIKRLTGASCTVNGILTEQYPTPAKRPAYSVMDKQKIRDTYGIGIPQWEASLARCIGKLKAPM